MRDPFEGEYTPIRGTDVEVFTYADRSLLARFRRVWFRIFHRDCPL